MYITYIYILYPSSPCVQTAEPATCLRTYPSRFCSVKNAAVIKPRPWRTERPAHAAQLHSEQWQKLPQTCGPPRPLRNQKKRIQTCTNQRFWTRKYVTSKTLPAPISTQQQIVDPIDQFQIQKYWTSCPRSLHPQKPACKSKARSSISASMGRLIDYTYACVYKIATTEGLKNKEDTDEYT
jgi:hypothetical protein